VKRFARTILLGAYVAGVPLGSFGCGETSLPVEPSPIASAADSSASIQRNVSPAAPGVFADDDTIGLKVTSPEPTAPLDVETDVETPLLVAENARGRYVDADFGYEFVIWKSSGGAGTIHERGAGMPHGAGSTAYQVQTGLDLASSYTWQVRAVLDGAHGPWSDEATFRTVAALLGVPEPIAPIEGAMTVSTRPAFRVRNGTVKGDAGSVFVQVRVGTDSNLDTPVAMARARAGSGAETSIRLAANLQPETDYYWQARAVASGGPAGDIESAWSNPAARFRTLPITLGAPEPRDPIDGRRVSGLRPVFHVRNGTVEGTTGAVRIEIQVALDDSFTNSPLTAESPADADGTTQLRLGRDLTVAKSYYWRARAVTASSGITKIVSEWSQTERFMTPDSSRPTTAPGRGDCCPPPNRFDIVQAVLARTGDLYRREIQEFTQRVAECLAVIDGDWGRRRNDSGAVGKDTVAYRTSRGRGRGPFSIDIMRGAESNNPQPHWNVQEHDGIRGRVGGSWIPVDGSHCILGHVN
jgi:hypothetical protein